MSSSASTPTLTARSVSAARLDMTATRPRTAMQRVGTIGCPTCSGNDSAACEAKFRRPARRTRRNADVREMAWQRPAARRPMRRPGHACTPRPADVLQGCGVCRVCKGMAWDVFYVVTSADVVKEIPESRPEIRRRRLRTHLRDGLSEVVRLVTGIPGAIAPDRRARQ